MKQPWIHTRSVYERDGKWGTTVILTDGQRDTWDEALQDSLWAVTFIESHPGADPVPQRNADLWRFIEPFIQQIVKEEQDASSLRGS